MLVLGTGATMTVPSVDFLRRLRELDIQLELLDTVSDVRLKRTGARWTDQELMR